MRRVTSGLSPASPLLLLALVAACDCGGDDGPADATLDASADASDAMMGDATDPDATTGRCGDFTVDPGEDCDDGNESEDDLCLNDCTFACGDGVVGSVEVCDTGIAPGEPGACPTACDDGEACTSDVLSAAGTCDARCEFGAIGLCMNGDGCCPSGCLAIEDDDCPAMCGNDLVEPGETCDPPGSCPSACDDGVACTTDTLGGDASMCTAACTSDPIVACAGGDGCCPAGCDAVSDGDCSASCGNGVVEPGESCDPPGSCPSSCDDMDVCTTDGSTGSAANCNLQCTNTPVTACTGGDGCCPSGCDATNDGDCMPICNNSVVEPGETCDPRSSCPRSCDDMNVCTTDTRIGRPRDCDAECVFTPITACSGGDGCCPSGCDSTTDSDCSANCGNSVIETGETCDPPGTCPTSCDDMNACTADSRSGSAANCNVLCTNTPITMCADGDGCCAPGCNNNNDDDCAPVCNNGVIESGESCDPRSSCPSSCDDMNACTTDVLSGSAATCTALCSNTPITACTNGDGCCPAGCDAGSDSDCAAVCDNGVVEPGETCDPIATCPTDCDDMDACTNDVLSGSAGTCTADCSNTPITACMGGDGCCAPGCNALNDGDCAPVCGNNVTEPPETCDDGNTTPGDGCDGMCRSESTPPTVFRIDNAWIRDPHLFLRVFFSCSDITDGDVFGMPGANNQLNAAIDNDADGDGFLDLSILLIFRPLDQVGSGATLEVALGQCTPAGVCDLDPMSPPQTTTYANDPASPCLQPYAGTTSGYSPGITTPGAPCFASGTVDLMLTIAGAPLTLTDADAAATYNGAPASSLLNGLMRGFITEGDAATTMIDLGILGVVSLESLLQPMACGGGDDRDMNGSDTGWWFYLNYDAVPVTYVGP